MDSSTSQASLLLLSVYLLLSHVQGGCHSLAGLAVDANCSEWADRLEELAIGSQVVVSFQTGRAGTDILEPG